MNRKTACIFVVLVLIQITFAGCAGNERPVNTDTAVIPSGNRTGDSGEQASDAAGILPGENNCVINDTVVDVFKEPDIQSQRITQVLYNQPVEIVEERESWTRIKASDDVSGWVRSRYVDGNLTSVKAGDYKFKIIITAKTKDIHTMPEGGLTVKEVVMGTQLFSTGKMKGAYEVIIPGGSSGWVSEGGTIQIPVNTAIPRTSAEDFAATVEKLKGTSYLQGGISARGIDYSGLAYICSKINGINLPRGAKQQYMCGKEVQPDAVEPGDLLFFSSKEGSDDISDVGVCISPGKFIHASKTKGYVMISELDEDYFTKRFIGARRIF